MKALNLLLLLSSSCAVAGCAAGAASGTDPVLDTDAAALTAATPVWPPRVDVPVGSHEDAVCGHDDGDTHAAFVAYAQSKGKQVTEHPDPNIAHWAREGESYVCRFCNLDGKTIAIPGPGVHIVIADSSARNTKFVNQSDGKMSLENVYARDANLDVTYRAGVALRARNTDLRCSSMALPAYHVPVRGTDFEHVDLSGAKGRLEVGGTTNDVRFTGSPMTVSLTGKATDIRLDGMPTNDVSLEDVTLSGTTRFDQSSWLNVEAKTVTFAGGTITMAGAGGYLKAEGPVTFDKVSMPDADGGFRIPEDRLWNVRFTKDSTLVVGAHAFIPDAQLASVKLAGVHLVSHEESWPTVTNLDHLVVTGGSLPAKTNLAGVSLVDARLEGIDFTDVVLSKQVSGQPKGAKLVGANLQRATLGGKLVDGVDFTRADLRGATLDKIHGSATFVQAQAGTLPAHTGANDTNQRIDTSFRGAILAQSQFVDAQLQYAIFANAALTSVAFDGAHLDFASFSKATFFQAGSTSAGDVFNQTLEKAASMHAVDFSDADLRKVSLAKADTTPMADDTNVVRRASFANAFMCGGDLSNARLGGANLSGLFFDVDGTVTFPDGTKGTCAGGKRAGAITAPASGIETSCPLYGQHPVASGECSDVQWKVPGDTSDECPPDTPKKRIDAPCTKACECASNFCSTEGVCAYE